MRILKFSRLARAIWRYQPQFIICVIAGALAACSGPAAQVEPKAIEGCILDKRTNYEPLIPNQIYSLKCKNADALNGVNITDEFETLSIEGVGTQQSLRLVGFPKIKSIIINDSDIKDLDLSNFTSVESVSITAKNLTNAKLPLSKITIFTLCDMASLKTLNFENISIGDLYLCGDNKFDMRALASKPGLNSLSVRGDALDLSDIAPGPLLRSLSIGDYTRPIDISRFVGLERLYLNKTLPELVDLSAASVDEIELEGATVKTLITGNKTSKIAISAHQSKSLTIKGEHIGQLNVTSAPALNALDIAELPNLSWLSIEGMTLPAMAITNKPKLATLAIKNSAFEHLDISNNAILGRFTIDATDIGTLETTQMDLLKELRVQDSNLNQIDLKALNNLRSVELYSLALTQLDLSNNPLLNSLAVADVPVVQLDLSNNKNLNILILQQTQLSCKNLHDIRTLFPAKLGRHVDVSDGVCQ
ncbi:MAG TPA: hypothetical protein VIZ65_12045 [Cellvibrionaceae bacterium]